MKTFSDLEEPQEFQPTLTFTIDDFVAVKFTMAETGDIKYYVGKILEIDNQNTLVPHKISFFRKATRENRFISLQILDIMWINRKDIVSKVKTLTTGRRYF